MTLFRVVVVVAVSMDTVITLSLIVMIVVDYHV